MNKLPKIYEIYDETQKSIPKKPEIWNGQFVCPACQVLIGPADIPETKTLKKCPVCSQRLNFKNRAVFSDMDKFLSTWFELTKLFCFMLLGLIPALVYMNYSTTGEDYDVFYSLITWALLILSEFGQISVTAYISKSKLSKEEKDEH